ncbi:MAG: GNAT family N-acetyltransferase [Caldilinea sp.]|nr:GNAT family N-acetyltransferase [Caldilinea sp.]MCB0067585.1 GNAT family N-acetyltransferase [Caldilineaceae bacterium]MCB9115576.1 GNAT family N-acetyltransferase [Caldilineaceae bacterium]MCB9121566.1 GNAT family N-acetyltransferase [Caldilineaceae bacterium]MCB9123140.1 GNAT family N-acetyltransferase [Caldilineaceae bacterium]
MIRFVDSLGDTTPEQLQGFFVGWPNPPSPQTHLRILQKSTAVELAVDDTTGRVVGFINALSDGVLMAYIPLLEVLPEYQGQGIGRTLVERMLARLGNLYAVDLLCDPELQPFYAQAGMQPATGMLLRNYARQAGADS